MKSTARFLTGIALAGMLVTGLAGCQPAADTKADVVLFGGTVYTVDPDWKIATAVAIKGNEILATGSDSEIEAYIGPDTKKIDLAGKAVLPGLIDSHVNLVNYSGSLDSLDLVETTSAEEIAAMVRAKAEEIVPGEWILGYGWDHNVWPGRQFPTFEILDEAAPDNPVLLTRKDGHAGWVNSSAMKLAGITRATQAPSGGEIKRDAAGNPSGVFVDAAMDMVEKSVPPMSHERLANLIEQAVDNCLAVGLTGGHNMSVPPVVLGGELEHIEIIKGMIEEGRFPFRLYFHLSDGLENLDEVMAQGHQNHGDGRLIVRAVKCFADGSLGSRSAAMLDPYTDDPSTSGLVVLDEAQLTDVSIRALKAGFQVTTHACGDRGAQITLNAYEAALKAVPTEDHRLRMEHAQMLAPEDIPRFAQLGVIPSMQPTHFTSDTPWVIDRIGMERVKYAYAWRTMLNTGVYVPCGSDFPVENINPMFGFYSAITRKHQDGTPEEPYYPSHFDEVMTREEVLKGFTIWAAKAAFSEDWLGSLEAGKRADLVVLDRDVMKVEPPEILGTKVVLTMVDGEVVYRGEEDAQQ